MWNLFLGHLVLGYIAGAVPIAGVPITGLFLAHQLVDAGQGEPQITTLADLAEFGFGFFVGHLSKGVTLSNKGG